MCWAGDEGACAREGIPFGEVLRRRLVTDWPWKNSSGIIPSPITGSRIARKGAVGGWVGVEVGAGGRSGGSYSKRLWCAALPSIPKRILVISRAGGQSAPEMESCAAISCWGWGSAASVLTQNDTHQRFQHEGVWWSVKLAFCIKLNRFLFNNNNNKNYQKPVSEVKEINLAEMYSMSFLWCSSDVR